MTDAPGRFRLRIDHRKLGSPLATNANGHYILREPEYDYQGKPIKNSEREIINQGIQIWPLDDVLKELLKIICPNSIIRKVDAASDERSVVYITDPPSSKQRAIVIINFNPTISKLRRLGNSPLPNRPGSALGKIKIAKAKKRERCGELKYIQRPVIMEPRAQIAPSTVSKPSFRTKEARYLRIKRGL